MGITANILRQITVGNDTQPGQAVTPRVQTLVTDGYNAISETVLAGETKNVACVIDPLYLQYLFIYASEAGVTFQPDPVTSGNPDIVIQDPGSPFLWSKECELSLPLHEPISTFTIHNPSASDASVEIRAGYNNP